MRQLQLLIDEWDPIGLLMMGAPSDEYECLAGPTFSRLAQGITVDELAQWLKKHSLEHFDVAAADSASFASKAVAWYRSFGE